MNSLENSVDDAELKESGNQSTMAAHPNNSQVNVVASYMFYICIHTYIIYKNLIGRKEYDSQFLKCNENPCYSAVE